MKADLHRLMSAHSVDTIIVPMHEALHSSFRWLSRGAKVTRGYAVACRDSAPLLIHYPMERDEAIASGLETRSIHDFHYNGCFSSSPELPTAYARFFDRVLNQLERKGTVAFFGDLPVHLYVDIIEEMRGLGWDVFRARGSDLIQQARKRKDAWELDAIASVGHRTEQVVDSVRQVLRKAALVGNVAEVDGRTLTIGDLKQLVSSEIYRLGMVEDHETILSQGRDAAIPHSRGTAADPVRGAMPLVIDIFPRDRESGYFFDLTRTFCIGQIPSELATIHAHVLDAFEQAREAVRAGTPASDYQRLVCDLFEGQGYATTRSDPTTLSGYVHSLGHGVGLDVHEKPSFSLLESNSDQIEIGDVITIEPGLYFPDREIGVRIEDTLFIDESGRAQSFSKSDRSLTP